MYAIQELYTKFYEDTPARGLVLSGCRSWDYGSVSSVGSEAATGYATAVDLVGGEGTVALVGEVEEAVDLCGLLEPVDEGGHFGVDGVGRASEADIDDDEGHIRDSEVAFGMFPLTELDVSAVVEIIVDTGTDRVSSRLRHRRRS